MSQKTVEESPPTPYKGLGEIGLNAIRFEDMQQRGKHIQGAYDKIKELRDLITDVKMGRIGPYTKVEEDPSETEKKKKPKTAMGIINETKRIVHEMEVMLHKASIPFGRAANQKWFAVMQKGWAKVLSEDTYGFLNTIEGILIENQSEGRPEITDWDLIVWTMHFIEIHTLECARMVAGITWDDRDVTTRVAAILWDNTDKSGRSLLPRQRVVG